MKKINLNSIKEHLSRDEMREISGGSGGGECTTNCHSTYYSCPNTGETGLGILCSCGWNNQTLYNVIGQIACQ
ncbi:TIGR04149 family rSAM-modified RiPP [Mariniflexile sp.]|uniref:TIGR04149 family rSAM-modified RiPP n=1 Tax=Mariniflexile sp. TaxID=1979402 RepID=UPI004048C84F